MLLLFISVRVHSVVSPQYSEIFVDVMTLSVFVMQANVSIGRHDVLISSLGSAGMTSTLNDGGNCDNRSRSLFICFKRQFDFTPNVCVLKPRISSDPYSIGVPRSVIVDADKAGSTVVSGRDSNTMPFVNRRISNTSSSCGRGFFNVTETSHVSFWTHWNAETNKKETINVHLTFDCFDRIMIESKLTDCTVIFL